MVGVIAPEASSLLGLVSRLAPVVVSGNAAVVIASERRPLPAVTLTEVLATSDVPGGVVNLITGLRRELVGHLAGHMDVNALDAFGAAPDEAATLEEVAVENVKRFVRPPAAGLDRYDWLADARAVAVPHRRVRRDQDRLAPDRRLSGAEPARSADEGDLRPVRAHRAQIPDATWRLAREAHVHPNRATAPRQSDRR